MNPLLSVSSLVLVILTGISTCTTSHPGPASTQVKQSSNWHLFTPPNKSFSVEVPCNLKQRNLSAIPGPIYEYGCDTEEASGLNFFTVSVGPMQVAERERMRDEVAFERSLKDSFSPNKRLLKLISLKIDGGIGREVIVTNTTDEMDNLRARVIIFGGRRYDVAFVATDVKALESATARRFFATFKPLP